MCTYTTHSHVVLKLAHKEQLRLFLLFLVKMPRFGGKYACIIGVSASAYMWAQLGDGKKIRSTRFVALRAGAFAQRLVCVGKHDDRSII